MLHVLQVSGLSQWVSLQLEGLGNLPTWVTSVLLSLFIALATEVTSNSATTTLFVPIVGELVSVCVCVCGGGVE